MKKFSKWSRTRRMQHGLTFPITKQSSYTIRSGIIKLYYKYGCQHIYGPIYTGTTNYIITSRVVNAINRYHSSLDTEMSTEQGLNWVGDF